MTPVEADVRWLQHTMKEVLSRLDTVEKQNQVLRTVVTELVATTKKRK